MESTILFIGEKHFAGAAAGNLMICLWETSVIGNPTNPLSTFEGLTYRQWQLLY